MPGVPRHGKSSIFSEADEAVAQLPLANIAFTAPQTLQPGDTTQVQLVLSARELIRQLKRRLSEIGVKHGAERGALAGVNILSGSARLTLRSHEEATAIRLPDGEGASNAPAID